MQTLLSAFDDRTRARRAMETLVESGFSREDLHLMETPGRERPAADPNDRVVGDLAMDSAEREIAVDRGALESVGHFFVSLFGLDHGDEHAKRYENVVRDGRSVVIVDARDDHEAETAAAILHEAGAVEVDDHVDAPSRPGVRTFMRESQPPLRELVAQRQREEHEHHA
jgi:hypothetical protein